MTGKFEKLIDLLSDIVRKKKVCPSGKASHSYLSLMSLISKPSSSGKNAPKSMTSETPVKLVLISDSGVGKTSIATQYIFGKALQSVNIL